MDRLKEYLEQLSPKVIMDKATSDLRRASETCYDQLSESNQKQHQLAWSLGYATAFEEVVEIFKQ